MNVTANGVGIITLTNQPERLEVGRLYAATLLTTNVPSQAGAAQRN